MRISAFLIISAIYAISPQVLASARAMFQDELVREADAIAVVRVYAKEVSSITGQIPASSSPDVGLILYSAKTIQKIAGDIPESPILIQFENDGADLNPLAKGTYLIFAKHDGQFFRPLSTEYRITDDQVFWFKKPFEPGGLGPEMGMVPLTKALDDIKMLLNRHKNANGPAHLTPTRRHTGCLICIASDPTPEPSPKIKSYTGGWGKGSGSASLPASRLDGLAPDQLKKTSDLAKPVEVNILAIGRSVEGIEEIKDRIIDVRVTNPNSYPIFFRGRQYKDNKTNNPGWNKLEDGVWKLAGWDWCGTHVRDWEIEPNGTIDLMLYLHPELKEQQILGRFFKADEPSIHSECVLYETK